MLTFYMTIWEQRTLLLRRCSVLLVIIAHKRGTLPHRINISNNQWAPNFLWAPVPTDSWWIASGRCQVQNAIIGGVVELRCRYFQWLFASGHPPALSFSDYPFFIPLRQAQLWIVFVLLLDEFTWEKKVWVSRMETMVILRCIWALFIQTVVIRNFERADVKKKLAPLGCTVVDIVKLSESKALWQTWFVLF